MLKKKKKKKKKSKWEHETRPVTTYWSGVGEGGGRNILHFKLIQGTKREKKKAEK